MILSHVRRRIKWFAALIVLCAGSAQAAVPTARLIFVRGAGAESCPDENALREMVAANLGGDPFNGGDDAEVAVRAKLYRQFGRLRAEITLFDRQGHIRGQRKLIEGNCRELALAAAFAISIALDPEVATRPKQPPEPEPVPEPEGAIETPEPAAAPPKSEPRELKPAVFNLVRTGWSRDRLSGRLGVGMLGDAGVQPTVGGLGFTVFGGLGRGLWSVNFEARGDVPFGSKRNGGTVKSSLVLGSIIPCVHIRFFAVCALASAGVQLGSGSGFSNSRSSTSPFIGAGLRGQFELALTRHFGLLIGADLLWAILRTNLTIGDNEVFSMSPVSGAIHLAGVFNF